MALHGVIASVVTPFRPDERIDFTAFQRVLEAALAGGVEGILALGPAGEFHALTGEERAFALRFCRQTVPAGKAVLVGNISGGSTREIMRAAGSADDDGLDAVLLTPPSFPVLNDAEVLELTADVCRAVRIPVMLSFDSRWSSLRLPGGALQGLASACENFSGAIDWFGDASVNHRTSIPAGDRNMIRALRGNAPAVVSECAGFTPRLVVELYKAVRGGREEDAQQLGQLLQPVVAEIDRHTFPSVLKLAIESAGLGTSLCRRPVRELPSAVRAELRPLFEAIWARVGRPDVRVLSRV